MSAASARAQQSGMSRIRCYCPWLPLAVAFGGHAQLSCASRRNPNGMTGWAVVGEVEKRNAETHNFFAGLVLGCKGLSIALSLWLCHGSPRCSSWWLSLSAPPVAAVAVCMWRVHCAAVLSGWCRVGLFVHLQLPIGSAHSPSGPSVQLVCTPDGRCARDRQDRNPHTCNGPGEALGVSGRVVESYYG